MKRSRLQNSVCNTTTKMFIRSAPVVNPINKYSFASQTILVQWIKQCRFIKWSSLQNRVCNTSPKMFIRSAAVVNPIKKFWSKFFKLDHFSVLDKIMQINEMIQLTKKLVNLPPKRLTVSANGSIFTKCLMNFLLSIFWLGVPY